MGDLERLIHALIEPLKKIYNLFFYFHKTDILIFYGMILVMISGIIIFILISFLVLALLFLPFETITQFQMENNDLMMKIFFGAFLVFFIGFLPLMFKNRATSSYHKEIVDKEKGESKISHNFNIPSDPSLKTDQSKLFKIYEFSENYKNKILDTLTERKVNLPCPRCGFENFTILDGYFVHQPKPTFLLGAIYQYPVVPSIVAICGRCGYISQHSLGILKLEPYQEGSDE